MLLAEAAHAANIPFILSGAGNASTEAVARVAPSAWYQLYIPRDVAIRTDLIKRAADAGLSTLVVTIDVPMMSKRERDIRNGSARSNKPTLAATLEALRHVDWMLGYLANGRPPMENWRRYAPPNASGAEIAALYAKNLFGPQTWETLKEIRAQWRGALVVKGVLHPEDAALAVAAGADGVIVSNHGGRQVDRAPASIAMLPAVHAAVGARIPVMFDGGITRGSDIVAAMCLGASFAFVGRATLYAVAACGLAGVAKAIQILQQEMNLVLATLGCPDVRALDASYVRQL